MAVNNKKQSPNIFDPVFRRSKLFGAKLKTIIFSEENADQTKIRQQSKVASHIKKQPEGQFPGNPIESVHIYGTDFHQTIQEYVENQKTDLLIMLTHHGTFMQNLFRLSRTRQMAYHINIPLLSLKGGNF